MTKPVLELACWDIPIGCCAEYCEHFYIRTPFSHVCAFIIQSHLFFVCSTLIDKIGLTKKKKKKFSPKLIKN